jgi:hypothetical protein
LVAFEALMGAGVFGDVAGVLLEAFAGLASAGVFAFAAALFSVDFTSVDFAMEMLL